MSWNLDQDTTEGFEFILGGHTYFFRYPSTEEITKAKKIKDGEQLDYLYGFVTGKSEGAPEIKEALAKQNIKVLQKFSEMIKTEFAVGS